MMLGERTLEEEDCWLNGEDLEDDYAEGDGFEFSDADEAMQCVEMAQQGAAAHVHDYEELAARKRKALAEKQLQKEENTKRSRHNDLSETEAATMFDQLMESFSRWRKRSAKEARKRGRKKGTRNKCNPQVTKMLGDATLLFTESKFKEAILILHEIVRIAPNLPNS